MNIKSRTLCSAFLATACALGAGCGTNPVQRQPAPVTPVPVTIFKNDLMNKTIELIVRSSIVNPAPEALAKAAIEGVRKEMGPQYAGYHDEQIKALIDNKGNPQHDKIFETAVSAIMASLSPHDSYMPEKKVQESIVGLKLVRGIGAHLIGDPDTGGLMIEEVADVGPAVRANLVPGDVIVAVDGHSINGDMLRGIDMIRGEDGSSITLSVLRKGQGNPVDIMTKRGEFYFKPVLHNLIGDVAYVRLRDFRSYIAGKLIKEALNEMQAARGGRPVTGLILDLRGNTGGLVTAAARIADDFIDSSGGVSFHVKSKKVEPYDETLTPGDILNGAPIMVLINDESASASELLAGTLQDHKRAIIIGTQSFGKGSMQTKEYLSRIDKSRNDAVLVTSAMYFLPSGVSIQQYGVTPDVEVRGVGSVRSEHERDMKGAIPNPTEALAKARQTRAVCTIHAELNDSDVPKTMRDTLRGLPDKALICAYEYLRQTSLYSRTQAVQRPALVLQP